MPATNLLYIANNQIGTFHIYLVKTYGDEDTSVTLQTVQKNKEQRDRPDLCESFFVLQ